jgi:hypothetical protein
MTLCKSTINVTSIVSMYDHHIFSLQFTMYRKYKGKFTPHGLRPFSAVDFLTDTDSLTSSSRPVSSMSLSHVELSLDTSHLSQDDVTRCWRKIEQQCWRYEQNRMVHRQSAIVRNTEHDWKTVRIFVSSTFTDFHNERDILVKKVIITEVK